MLQSAISNNTNMTNKATVDKKNSRTKDISAVFDQMLIKHQKTIQKGNKNQRASEEKDTLLEETKGKLNDEICKNTDDIDENKTIETKDNMDDLLKLYAFWNQEGAFIEQVSKVGDAKIEKAQEMDMIEGLTAQESNTLFSNQESAIEGSRQSQGNTEESAPSIFPLSHDKESGNTVGQEQDFDKGQGNKVTEVQSEKLSDYQKDMSGLSDTKEQTVIHEKKRQIGELEIQEEHKDNTRSIRTEEKSDREENSISHIVSQTTVFSTKIEQAQPQIGIENQAEVFKMTVSNLEQLPEQLMKQLETMHLTENKEFEIELEPANLGKIAMKISYEQGKASISLICSNSMTATVLTGQAEQMGQLMEKHLGSPTEIFVDRQENMNWQEQDSSQRESQNSRQQKEEQERRYYEDLQHRNGQDFLQQLRIGLI